MKRQILEHCILPHIPLAPEWARRWSSSSVHINTYNLYRRPSHINYNLKSNCTLYEFETQNNYFRNGCNDLVKLKIFRDNIKPNNTVQVTHAKRVNDNQVLFCVLKHNQYEEVCAT